ncbi:MAG: haloacid dehalogenase type II [Pseudomonadota bacterium]
MIKSALFDVFGTCVDWRTGVANFIRPMLHHSSLDPTLSYEIADAWRKLYDPAMEKVRDGSRDYVTLDIIQRENLDIVLDNLDLEAHFKDDVRDLMNQAWEQLPAWPDTADGLATFKSAMPIAACSNGSSVMMQRLAGFANLPWSMICGADTARNFKPHRDVYLNSCEALGTTPEETLMIACHADDLDAAATFGLKTAYFPQPSEWGDKTFMHDINPDRFTFHANTFTQLADMVTARC